MADGEGIRPDTVWLRGDLLSLHLVRNHGEGVSGTNLVQTQSHPLLESGCFLSNRSQHRLDIARMLNKDKKRTGADQGEGMRPETEPVNGSEAIN